MKIAIVDYGLGNLFSIKHACGTTGLQGFITSSIPEILAADAIILPGVGAFGDAMNSLKKLDLIKPLQDISASSKPLYGICLGMQLLMTESYEFGKHKGLGIIKGEVVRFKNPVAKSRELKIPHVGWNRIFKTKNYLRFRNNNSSDPDSWSGSPLEGIPNGEYMYFVHSFYPKPEDSTLILSTTHYGNIEFCSSIKYKNIFATQFHPERSSSQGLFIYKNIANYLTRMNEKND